jgi:hypothetical protein
LPASPAIRVALALAALQFGLHAIAWPGSSDPRMVVPHAVALLHDLLVLGAAQSLSALASP